MRNKWLVAILSLILSLTLGCAITACANDEGGNENQDDACEHVWDEGTVTKPATCEEDGVRTYTCQKDSSHTKTEKIDALGHKWDDGKVTKSATCTEKGVKTFTCQNDSKHTKTEDIPTTAHKMQKHAGTPATCTAPGTKDYWTCENESENVKYANAEGTETLDDLTLSATGHKMQKHTGTPATCTAPGTKDYWTCENESEDVKYANAEGTETLDNAEIPAKGHNMTFHEATATCTESGNRAYYTCENEADNVYYADLAGEEKLTTLQTDGLGHDMTQHAETPPSCLWAGFQAYWSCSREPGVYYKDGDGNAVWGDDFIIPSLGHTYAEEWSKDAENHWHKCVRCDDKSDTASHSYNAQGKCVCGAEQTTGKQLTIVFDSKGGSKVENQTVYENWLATEPFPTNDNGDVFIAWFKEEAYTNVFTFDTPITEGMTLYAKWATPETEGTDGLEYEADPTDTYYICKGFREGFLKTRTNKIDPSDPTEIVIPMTYQGKPVREIADNAFCDHSSGALAGYLSGIVKVTIPDTVRKIGAHAFENTRFPAFELGGARPLALGEYAFARMFAKDAKTFVLPEGVTSIPAACFFSTDAIQTLTLPKSLRRIENASAGGSLGVFRQSASGKLTALELPEGVEYIGSYAFEGVSNLQSVTFAQGSKLKTIAEGAFCNAKKLKTLELPEGLEIIEKDAFVGTAVAEMTVPSTVKYVGTGAFRMNTALTKITFLSETITIDGYPMQKGSLVNGCTALTDIVFTYTDGWHTSNGAGKTALEFSQEIAGNSKALCQWFLTEHGGASVDNPTGFLYRGELFDYAAR